MSILLADNFSYLGRKPLDGRLVFDTIANMAAMAESTLYDGIISYNLEDKKFYTYKSTNAADTTLGKWEEFKTGAENGEGIVPIKEYKQGTAYTKGDVVYDPFYNLLLIATKDFVSDDTEAEIADSIAKDLNIGNFKYQIDPNKFMLTAPEKFNFKIINAGTGYAVNEIVSCVDENDSTLTEVNAKITQVGIDGDILQVEKTTNIITATNGTGAKIQATPKFYVGHGDEWYLLPETEIGNSSLTETILSNVEVGGAPAGTSFNEGLSITEAFKKILRKVIIPTANFTITNGGLHEQGTSVANSKLTLTISNLAQVTSEINNVTFKVGNIELQSIDFIPGTATYSADYTTSMTTDTTFTAIVTYDTDQTLTYTNKILFVYPSYFGSVDSLTPTETTITALTKIIKDKKAYTAENISLTDARFCYVYPSSFGNLASIKDANNFEYINSYTKTSISIDSINYNVYILTDPVTITGAKQIYA